jgi:hypothetical protein
VHRRQQSVYREDCELRYDVEIASQSVCHLNCRL